MKCAGKRRDGLPCSNTAKDGEKFCFWHRKDDASKSKQLLARNMRLWTPEEMALVFQKEVRKFLRGKLSESKLHELRIAFETIAAFSGKKFQPKEKKSLTLEQRIKRAEEKSKEKET